MIATAITPCVTITGQHHPGITFTIPDMRRAG